MIAANDNEKDNKLRVLRRDYARATELMQEAQADLNELQNKHHTDMMEKRNQAQRKIERLQTDLEQELKRDEQRFTAQNRTLITKVEREKKLVEIAKGQIDLRLRQLAEKERAEKRQREQEEKRKEQQAKYN